MNELKGREIFAVGTWNDMEFTDADLDDIVANFDKLKDTHKVPLKFGHNDEQKITDGQPAIGWISNVVKVGSKLFADFSHLPRTVLEAIKNKLYRTVSVELLFNVDSNGKKFNHVLDAVALLGADHPAVNSLADLDALLATRTSFTGGHRVAFETVAGKSKLMTKKEVDMDEKDVQKIVNAALDPLKEANADLTKKLETANQTIANFTQKQKDDEIEKAKDAVKLARKAVTEVLDAAVKAKSITPAFRENYEKQIGVADDARVVAINVDEIKQMFSIKEGKPTQQGLHQAADDDVTENPEAELLALTRKNQTDTGEKDFVAAFSRVCASNPKLHRAYLDSNGVK